METKKTEFKLVRIIYHVIWRGSVRVMTVPFRGLREGRYKNSLRTFILKFQLYMLGNLNLLGY